MVWPLTKMSIHLSYGVQYLEYTVGGIQDVNHSKVCFHRCVVDSKNVNGKIKKWHDSSCQVIIINKL